MLSVTFGVGIGIIQLRNLVKTRQIQLYMELYNSMNEKEKQRDLTEVLVIWNWKDPDEFFEKYGPEKHLDEFMKFTSTVSYLENIGLFVKEKLVDIRWVANLVDSLVLSFWEKYKPIISEMEQRFGTPVVMPMTEYLYKQVKSYRQW